MCDGFEIGGVRLNCTAKHYDEHPSAALDEETQAMYRREEDEWAAMDTLGTLVVHYFPDVVPPQWKDRDDLKTWQGLLMYLLKPVSKHYGVSDENVLRSFLKHYLPSLILKHGIGDIPVIV